MVYHMNDALYRLALTNNILDQALSGADLDRMTEEEYFEMHDILESIEQRTKQYQKILLQQARHNKWPEGFLAPVL